MRVDGRVGCCQAGVQRRQQPALLANLCLCQRHLDGVQLAQLLQRSLAQLRKLHQALVVLGGGGVVSASACCAVLAWREQTASACTLCISSCCPAGCGGLLPPCMPPCMLLLSTDASHGSCAHVIEAWWRRQEAS